MCNYGFANVLLSLPQIGVIQSMYMWKLKSKEFWPDTIVRNLDTWTKLDLACVGRSRLVLL